MAVGSNGGSGGGGNAVRAGGAYFEVFANDKMSGTLDKLKSKAKAFATGLAQTSRAAILTIGKLGAVGAVAGGGLLFRGMREAADTKNAADALGISVELMSKFRRVAEDYGVSIDDVLTDTTGRFSQAIDAAKAKTEGDQ